MDIMFLLFLIALNGVFALSEMSIIASNKNRLQSLAQDGNKGAAAALFLASNPNNILATTQIGLTFITLIEGVIGAQLYVANIQAAIPSWEWIMPWKEDIAKGVMLAGITFVTLILGEMLPKRIAMLYPEAIACFMAPKTQILVQILKPLIATLSYFTNRIMVLFGLPTVKSQSVSEEDVEGILEAAQKAGLLSAREMNIMDNVWRMDERKVGAIMTPRQNIQYIDIEAPSETNLDVLANHPRLRLLVVKGGLDNVIGMAPTSQWTKQLMRDVRIGKKPEIDWMSGITPAHSIPNSLTLTQTLESFRAHKTHVAVVYNEFGQFEGLVTMSDLIDAVVGEMPQSPEQATLVHRDENGDLLIEGLATIPEVKAALHIDTLPGETDGAYQTAGGFAMWMIGRKEGRLAKEFDVFEFQGMTWKVVDIDRNQGYRIDQLLVTVNSKPAA